jgi:hypothetical protein
MLERLKEKWNIKSNFQILMILVVFSITGSASLYVGKPVLSWLDLQRSNFETDFIWGGLSYYALRILVIFPIYQVLLITIGTLLGQFQFFWNVEKKMLKRFKFWSTKT